ncbi:unnamed protein product [Clonostachys solani]|uniref:gamma-glutamylcyclotransferase n=1 Tax=Clonostachys solani TaxID=160281 RepID=A0A9N9W4R8_9HYPO|nr:unnamed protein product [Clonostachys solani]
MLVHEDSQQSQGSTMTLMEERHEIIYFAYGSNLSTRQMLKRCPSSTPIGLGHLPGWKWIINERGYANVIRDTESSPKAPASSGVFGLLYLLPPQDEDSLDRHEGVPWAYQKFKLDMSWIKDDQKNDVVGQEVTALVYIDQERVVESAPKEEYIERMHIGIADAIENWGLDEQYAESMRRKLVKKNETTS